MANNFFNVFANENIPAHKYFPPQFKWCVATAAHQIEGGNKDNDWWEWEHIYTGR